MDIINFIFGCFVICCLAIIYPGINNFGVLGDTMVYGYYICLVFALLNCVVSLLRWVFEEGHEHDKY